MANYRCFGKLHTQLYQMSHGLIGHKLGGHPCALLYTTGAKSGLPRITPVQYYPLDQQGIVVIGSNNGQPRPPAWWFNMQADPEFDIRVGRELRRVRAELITGKRRAELWPKIEKINPRTRDYAAIAGREIPVILLRTLETH